MSRRIRIDDTKVSKDEWLKYMKKYGSTALQKAHAADEESEGKYWRKIAHMLNEEVMYFETGQQPVIFGNIDDEFRGLLKSQLFIDRY